jgi:hypothetical protein
MPVVRGTTLRQRMRAGDPRSRTFDVGAQSHARCTTRISSTSCTATSPENIMLVREESGASRVRIMDFGPALHARRAPALAEQSQPSPEQRLTRSDAVMGTSLYLAPEQLRERSIDARADLYSLGTVLYECLAGEPPFSGALPGVLYRVAYETPRSLRALGVDVPVALDDLLLRCMAKEPRERPASGAELAGALEGLRASLGDSARQARTRPEKSAAPVPAEVPFTDREREFAQVQERLTRAAQGECQLVLVAGDIGVGKSRLLRELGAGAGARMQVPFGRCVDHEQGLALYGFCDLILDFFRHARARRRPRAARLDLRDDLVRRFPMLGDQAPARERQRAHRRGRARARSGGEARRVRALARALLRIVGGRPSVLLLGSCTSPDLDRGPAVRRAPPRRGAVHDRRHVPVARVDRAHPSRACSACGAPGSCGSTCAFPPDAHRVSVGHLLGDEHVSGELVRELFEATDGNPFFTQELVHALLSSGSISRDGSGAWHVAAAREIRSDELPGTIQQAVEKRIHGLPDELRELLASAAVLGKACEVRDLAFLVQDERRAERRRPPARLGLFEERGSRRDRVGFASGVLRDPSTASSRPRAPGAAPALGHGAERRHAGGRTARAQPCSTARRTRREGARARPGLTVRR